ncbi:hypothetical protein SCHPADRAFT_459863 [Schizopora paradoxa]|uniref:Uncharacterized protein n=1 Tax=Schizopora paradoxa TaxID=27342 RepID=A0A0H2RQE2_9AGAM|nr:hypothetical protein SCHPADRAFT_459863 [Schizopora paradoxa]
MRLTPHLLRLPQRRFRGRRKQQIQPRARPRRLNNFILAKLSTFFTLTRWLVNVSPFAIGGINSFGGSRTLKSMGDSFLDALGAAAYLLTQILSLGTTLHAVLRIRLAQWRRYSHQKIGRKRQLQFEVHVGKALQVVLVLCHSAVFLEMTTPTIEHNLSVVRCHCSLPTRPMITTRRYSRNVGRFLLMLVEVKTEEDEVPRKIKISPEPSPPPFRSPTPPPPTPSVDTKDGPKEPLSTKPLRPSFSHVGCGGGGPQASPIDMPKIAFCDIEPLSSPSVGDLSFRGSYPRDSGIALVTECYEPVRSEDGDSIDDEHSVRTSTFKRVGCGGGGGHTRSDALEEELEIGDGVLIPECPGIPHRPSTPIDSGDKDDDPDPPGVIRRLWYTAKIIFWHRREARTRNRRDRKIRVGMMKV